jgi:hypothetical protein
MIPLIIPYLTGDSLQIRGKANTAYRKRKERSSKREGNQQQGKRE